MMMMMKTRRIWIKFINKPNKAGYLVTTTNKYNQLINIEKLSNTKKKISLIKNTIELNLIRQ